MNNYELKNFLENEYLKYKHLFSSKDPVWILHSFQDERDIEIAGLITSCYAYGRVEQINKFINSFLKRINFKVHEFTVNFSAQKDKKFLKGMNYRFNTEDDFFLLMLSIKQILDSDGSLKNLFAQFYKPDENNLLSALKYFSGRLRQHSFAGSSYNFLIPAPEKNSACKRLNLFLRWMVRKDEIDTGIWSDKVSKSHLIMPVDTHIYKISGKLKLAKRKSCDLKFATELTTTLKNFDAVDPVKYDFALCHIGIDKKEF